MFTSFSTALSALNAQSTAIDVVGNNLANLNTPGFKTSVVSFHDLVTQSLGAGLGETQVGFGVGRPITLREFSQGALQTTSGPLDVAIQGDGFFVVAGANNATEYTRGGNLQVDRDGNLLTATGEKVQGWTQTNNILDTNGPIGNIQVPVGSVKAPIATTSFSFDMNLNAAAAAGTPDGTFSTSVEVFDSLGTSHVATANFTKDPTTAGQWNYSISVPDADLKNPPFTPLTGSITFDPNGKMTSPAPTDPAPQLQIQGLADGAGDMTINWNLYNSQTPRLSQYAQPNAISAVAQDGSAAAQLVKVGIGDGGNILAQYSNGQQIVVGQLAMATIRNPDSLIAVGNNNYMLSARTALPAIGTSGTGGRGSVLGGAVESSTVDIAQEFTDLIVLQRGYQANAKVITAVDQLSQETINLKQ
jgi:flagellar hook protein FlgE